MDRTASVLIILGLSLGSSCKQNAQPVPSDFTFKIEGGEETIDGFTNTYTRRLVEKQTGNVVMGDSTIYFKFTTKEKDTIYQLLSSIDYFCYPRKLPLKCKEYNSGGTTTQITVRANNHLTTVTYSSSCQSGEEDKQATQLKNALFFIEQIATKHEVVKKMPESKMIYL